MEGVATDLRSERMNKMVAAFDKAMTKTLNGCTQKLFLESYPAQLTAEHKDIFIAAHERFLPVLHTNIKDEVSAVSDRYQVAAKLQLIDQWKENQLVHEMRSKSLEPLDASPMELAAALEVESKKREREKLLQTLRELEEQRERLEQEHEAKVERQQALTRQIEDGTLQIEKAVAVARQWAQADAREWQSKQEAH